ncbi:hypothetical protein H5410_064291 [Solanum commersonii]|uniref:Uncharacterized protein n=1 Tax=Solanum commersonii TaxID=4109 RepID=A0A9J5VZZ2_SOLCO|nr:hypothetical protein H5410_064291 [Solanum commersonii]
MQMYDASPSKRITRGTPLHVQVVANRPSFPLSLTQDFGNLSIKPMQVYIKIVEGGSKRKAKDRDSNINQSRTSYEVVSACRGEEAAGHCLASLLPGLFSSLITCGIFKQAASSNSEHGCRFVLYVEIEIWQ